MNADFLIDNADRIYTCRGPAPRRGPAQRDAGAIEHASVAAWRGDIVAVGAADEVGRAIALTPDAVVIDATIGRRCPGFVDPHTHLVFAGDRRDELRTASRRRELRRDCRRRRRHRQDRGRDPRRIGGRARRRRSPRLDAMLACGTTTVEVKSGYGLDTESELRMLRAIRAARRRPADRALADLHGRPRDPRRVSRSARRVRATGDRRDDAGGRDRRPGRVVRRVLRDRRVHAGRDRAASCWPAWRTASSRACTPTSSRRAAVARSRRDVGARSADHLIFVDEARGGRRCRRAASSRRCCRRRRSISGWAASRRPAC